MVNERINCPDETLPDVIKSHIDAANLGCGISYIESDNPNRAEQSLFLTGMAHKFVDEAVKDEVCLRHQLPDEFRTSITKSILRYVEECEVV